MQPDRPRFSVRPATVLTAGFALAAAACAASAGITWCRYGHAMRTAPHRVDDPLLDRFFPLYEIREHHRIRVAAPAAVTFSAACDLDLLHSILVRAIFTTRRLVLGGEPEEGTPRLRLIDQAKLWGWGVLAEIPGREIILGAVTRPWVANPVFRALPPADFAAFHAHGYVKIAWTLRADPVDAAHSVASTETRVVATDPASRARFRQYWSLVSPGAMLIRRLALRLVKAQAERHPHPSPRPAFDTPPASMM